MNPFTDIWIPKKIIAIGASITGALPFDYYRDNVVNAGISSETSDNMVARTDALLAANPTAVALLMIDNGTNDLMLLNSFNVGSVLSMSFKAIAAGMLPLICQIPPISHASYPTDNDDVRVWNANLVSAAASNNLFPPIDLFTPLCLPSGAINHKYFIDGCHPNKDGRDVIIATIRAALNVLL